MKYITKDGKVSPKAGQVEIPKSLQVEITAMTNKFRREMAEMADLTTVPFQRMLQTNRYPYQHATACTKQNFRRSRIP